MRDFLISKVDFLRHLSWFLMGFFWGSSLNVVSLICLIFSLLFDFFYYAFKDYKLGSK